MFIWALIEFFAFLSYDIAFTFVSDYNMSGAMNAARFAWIKGILQELSNFGEGMDDEQKCEYIERDMCIAFPGVVTSLKASEKRYIKKEPIHRAGIQFHVAEPVGIRRDEDVAEPVGTSEVGLAEPVGMMGMIEDGLAEPVGISRDEDVAEPVNVAGMSEVGLAEPVALCGSSPCGDPQQDPKKTSRTRKEAVLKAAVPMKKSNLKRSGVQCRSGSKSSGEGWSPVMKTKEAGLARVKPRGSVTVLLGSSNHLPDVDGASTSCGSAEEPSRKRRLSVPELSPKIKIDLTKVKEEPRPECDELHSLQDAKGRKWKRMVDFPVGCWRNNKLPQERLDSTMTSIDATLMQGNMNGWAGVREHLTANFKYFNMFYMKTHSARNYGFALECKRCGAAVSIMWINDADDEESQEYARRKLRHYCRYGSSSSKKKQPTQ